MASITAKKLNFVLVIMIKIYNGQKEDIFVSKIDHEIYRLLYIIDNEIEWEYRLAVVGCTCNMIMKSEDYVEEGHSN